MTLQTTYRQFSIAVLSFFCIAALKVGTIPSNIHEAAVVPNIPSHTTAPVVKAVVPATMTLERALNVSPKSFRRPASMTAFLKAIAMRESHDDPFRVNKIGMMGKYQFSQETIKRLGFNVTPEEFLGNESLQDSIMMANLRYNFQHLYPIIRRYRNTWKDSTYITTAGILAGAHLVGIGGIKTYFFPDQYNYRTVDGNGVSVGNYIQKFANYRISLR